MGRKGRAHDSGINLVGDYVRCFPARQDRRGWVPARDREVGLDEMNRAQLLSMPVSTLSA